MPSSASASIRAPASERSARASTRRPGLTERSKSHLTHVKGATGEDVDSGDLERKLCIVDLVEFGLVTALQANG